MRRDSFLTDITGFKGFWGLELGFSFSLSSALPSAPVPHNRTLAGSPVMRVHPSGTDWRQERRPQHLQTSSHCMHGYNIVSKITIRPHFFWKGKVHDDYVLLSLKYKYCSRRVDTLSDFANFALTIIK